MRKRPATRGTWAVLAVLAVLAIGPTSVAQESESYRIEGSTIGSIAGSPAQVVSSTAYRITLTSLGESVADAAPLTSLTYETDPGFVASLAPPSEVTGLLLTDDETLVWSAGRNAVSYDLYRGVLSQLPTSYGGCRQASIAATSATDSAIPTRGSSFFYLVSARNQLEELGTAGTDSALNERRPGSCP